MRPSLPNAISLLAVLATEYWLLSGYFAGKTEPEPVAALLVAIAALFYGENALQRVGWLPTHSEHDEALFQRFLNEIPPEHTTAFLRQHDFGNAFNSELLQPIERFVRSWAAVNTEFHDPRLQALKETVYGSAADFDRKVGELTSPVGSGATLSVYSDSLRESGQPRPDWVVRDASVLNEAAASLLRHYEEFVRTCQARLRK